MRPISSDGNYFGGNYKPINEPIVFCRSVGHYIFNDEQCLALLSGRSITFDQYDGDLITKGHTARLVMIDSLPRSTWKIVVD